MGKENIRPNTEKKSSFISRVISRYLLGKNLKINKIEENTPQIEKNIPQLKEQVSSFNIDHLANKLARFYGKKPNLAEKAIAKKDIIKYLKENPKASKKKVYGAISKNKSINPYTHASGKKEGGLKDHWGNKTKKLKPAAPRRF